MRKVKSYEEIKLDRIITKYPKEGESLEGFKLEPDNQIRYQVYRIKGNMVELKMPDDELQGHTPVLAGMKVSGTGGNPPVLSKTLEELSNEGIWWIDEN